MQQNLTLFIGMVVALSVATLTACGTSTPSSQNTPVVVATSTPFEVTVAPATVTEATPTESKVDAKSESTGEGVTTASGLQYIELKAGDGPTPKVGEIVAVHYKGTLKDGTVFDESYSKEPIKFPLGRGMVIQGWDEGIGMMKVGGKAKLIIPPNLGYGEQGAGNAIPPNSTLTFEVELVAIEAGSPESPTKVNEADYTTTSSGLKYYDMKVGAGVSPTKGQAVLVNYTGWLTDGTKFDSSIDRGQPFNFNVGAGRVIPGWDEGILTMKVGGKRQLLIPSTLAYGENGAGGVIPPNATLIFEVDLLDVK